MSAMGGVGVEPEELEESLLGGVGVGEDALRAARTGMTVNLPRA